MKNFKQPEIIVIDMSSDVYTDILRGSSFVEDRFLSED